MNLVKYIAGDFASNQVSKKEKHEYEENAVDTLFENVNFDNDFKKLWLEYENQLSKEAIYVKQVDKLEPILQAVGYDVNPKEYFNDDAITIPFLRDLLNEVYNYSD